MLGSHNLSTAAMSMRGKNWIIYLNIKEYSGTIVLILAIND